MIPTGFRSWREYGSFSLAREFIDPKTLQPFAQIGWGERVGGGMASFVTVPFNFCLREARNPLFIAAATIASIALVTLCFYPVEAFAVASTLFPFLKSVSVWHVRAGLYALSQIILLGMGVRTFSRLSNQVLMDAYRTGRAIPIAIGAVHVGIPDTGAL